MLEYNSRPIETNWENLEWRKVEEEIDKKREIENTRYGKSYWNPSRLQETKSKLFELLFAVAKVYSRLGRRTHAQRIFEITNTYGLGVSGALSQRLDYICDVGDIEENESILEALGRLESILPDITHLENQAVIQRLYGYIRRSYRLYKRIGLEDIAEQLRKKSFGNDAFSTPKEMSLERFINQIKEGLKTELPTKIILNVIRMIKYLRNKDDDISSYSGELNALIAAIAEFIDEWIQHSEVQRKENLKYPIAGVTLPSLLSRLDYAEAFSYLAINLCEIFNRALLPRCLRHLARVQRDLNKTSWVETAIESCLKADKLGDPVNFLKSFYMIKRAIEDGIEITISGYRRAELFKSTISIGEKIIEWNVFQKEREKFSKIFSTIIDFSTFELAEIGIKNNHRDLTSWIFRGLNLMKSRALTGLTLELSKSSKIHQGKDHLEYKEIQFLENKQRISKKDDGKDTEHYNDLYQKKYELYTKIKDKLGIGNCNAEKLIEVLVSYNPKKVSVVSFLISNDKLLVTGVSNYKEAWFKLYEFKSDIFNDLVAGCWQDFKFKDGDGDIEYLQEAFTTLISPINEYIEGSDLLYIIPDDKSYNLPFHAFYSAKEKRFLIEKYEIAYILSL